eukprot:COSAG01_NODE_61350_length_290_cov_0.596859_2_plen_35_part_01
MPRSYTSRTCVCNECECECELCRLETLAATHRAGH